MKKIITWLLIAAMVISMGTLFGGCQDEVGRVYFLNDRPETDETWQKLANEYTEITGVEVRVVTANDGLYSAWLSSEMDGADAPTLFQCGAAEDLLKWDKYCLDLSETDVYREMTTDEFNLIDENGAVKAIGYCYEAFGIIVNKALLKKAGYEIADIQDFASLKAIAEDITAKSAELGFGAFAVPDLDGAASRKSVAALANIPLHHEFADDLVTKQPSDIKGTYLENYKNIWDLYLSNSFRGDSGVTTRNAQGAGNDFTERKAVFCQGGTWEYQELIDAGLKAEDLQMIPVYCGINGEEQSALCCNGGGGWAVNARASELDRQATLDFLHWIVTSGSGTRLMTEQFGAIPFKAARDENVLGADVSSVTEEGKYIVSWAIDYAPNADSWTEGVVSALADYSAGTGQWSAVAAAFVEGWSVQYKSQQSG